MVDPALNGWAWLPLASDAGIALGCYALPAAGLLLLSRTRTSVPTWALLAPVAFLVGLGTMHLAAALSVLRPLSTLDGVVKGLAGILSLAAVAVLCPAIVRVLARPHPEDLEEANRRLTDEVSQRRTAEEASRAVNAELEHRVEERTRELKRSNEQLELMAYVASHDLQEPLRMVASYTQLLQVMYKGKLDAEADQYIERAVDGTIRMQELIDAVLSYARVDTRPGGFKFTSSEQALKLATLNLTLPIKESGAEISHGPLPVVYADLVQIVQVFQNLVSNAIKYRGEDAPRIEVSAEETGDLWTFSVRDHGQGIEPKNFERIFAMFRRLHGSSHPGTGMGLAICRRILERHGGTVWVEAAEGAGALFKFTLPKRVPATVEA